MRGRGLLFGTLALAALLPGLSACDSWLGEEEGPPLEGTRISVMAHEAKALPAKTAQGVTIVLPKPEPNPDWPQTGGLSHHAMVHLALPDAISEAWSVSLGEGSDSRNRLLTAPVVAADKVFAMDVRAHATAFDAKTGSRLWRVDLTPDGGDEVVIRGGGLAYDDGLLYATTGVGELWCLNAESGGFYWKARVDSPIRSAPTVYGGRVFVVTASNKVMAFAARDGKKLWEYEGVEETTGLLGSASPAADHGVLVAAMRGGGLLALRVESGALLWEDMLSTARRADVISGLADVKAPPVIADGRVYAVGNGGVIAAIDLRTGNRLWDRDVGGIDLPWVAGNAIFLLSSGNELMALERNSGKPIWVTPLSVWKNPEDKKGRIVWTGPILAGDRLILGGSHRYLLSVSPYSGKVLGYEKISDGLAVPPIAAGGTVYFLTTEADLLAFR